MGRIVFILCLVAQLFWWDMRLKLTKIISTRAVRRYIADNISGMARRLFGFARAFVGLKLTIDRGYGPGLPESFLLVSNHQSLIDIAAIIAAFPDRHLRFVAKHELRAGFPGVSPILRYERHALIERSGNFTASIRAIRRLARKSVGGVCPVVFPEGTRSRDGVVRDFRTGAVRTILATRSLPIVGVAVNGGYRLSTLADLSRSAGRTVYRVAVVGVEAPPQSKSEIESKLAALATRIRERVTEWQNSEHSAEKVEVPR